MKGVVFGVSRTCFDSHCSTSMLQVIPPSLFFTAPSCVSRVPYVTGRRTSEGSQVKVAFRAEMFAFGRNRRRFKSRVTTAGSVPLRRTRKKTGIVDLLGADRMSPRTRKEARPFFFFFSFFRRPRRAPSCFSPLLELFLPRTFYTAP